jgi:hypothetical protein
MKPLVTIPMHFKTEKCAFPIAPVEEFTEGKGNVTMKTGSELEVTKGVLPSAAEIFVLQPALAL